MHRIFAALPIPDEIAERLLPLRSVLPGARWRQREHFHLTLQFFGEVDMDVAEDIAVALERVQSPIIEIAVQGVGWFGRKEPRAVYARIGETEALTQLAAECRKIARDFGLKIDTKPFKPHITLAYCKDSPLAAVRAWSEEFQTLRSQPFLCDSFYLYESFTSPKRQSRYVTQADYRLG